MTSPTRRTLRWLAAAFALLGSFSASAACTGDCISSDSFENLFFVPANDADAARFLNQATFGATRAQIATVKAQGFEQFIDLQVNVAPTLARPFLEALAATRRLANDDLIQDDRIHRWFDTAVNANDAVRQKVAYALGQIIVTSDQNDFLSNEPLQMAEWNDIMVRNAFGNYRDLLREASFSPMMGRYLTHLRNRKYQLNSTFTQTGSNPVLYNITAYTAGNNGTEPDENYAREIMQLFSIGLVTRNRDFSIVDTDLGTTGIQELPTYDQLMIRTLSRAFTGLSYDCTGTQTVQGVQIVENCSGPGARNSAPPPSPACTGINCRFSNRDTLFFEDPPRAQLPNATGDSSLIHPDWYRPMVCYPRYNDNGRDQSRFQLPGQNAVNPVNTTIAPGIPIPSGAPDRGKALTLSGAVLTTLDEFQPGVSKETALDCSSTSLATLSDAQRLQCVNYCEDNVRSSVDLLFNHPNTGPMVARQLIEHIVSSNPSAGYIDRVAAVFNDNGSGVRGDLKAVVKAVLLDTEARQAPSGQLGKTREPMLRLVSMWRSFGAVSGGNTCRNPNAGAISCWGPTRPQDTYFQRPLGAPSVFNFYEPDYQQAGPIADAGLYSPEYQIINENSMITTANDLYSRVCAAYGSNNCSGAFATTAPTDRAYLPPAAIDALPGVTCATNLPNGCTGAEDLALIEEINLRLMGGNMSGQVGNPALCSDASNFGMKSVLHNLLRCGLTGRLGQTGTTADIDARRRKALYLIHMTLISPEYALQK